ncbi:hypothetical protein CPB84DRAFT_1958355 [Gymnopilus junonius]|uniref:Uncharacterized protein n=1 Tax=Gymnopilus junonius TaxID=109634 RepID=A0A9P5NVB7_GYMJU|nr:hypothetical protein CPB84DRAFT_1958355 [Gymnopilus junonius]
MPALQVVKRLKSVFMPLLRRARRLPQDPVTLNPNGPLSSTGSLHQIPQSYPLSPVPSFVIFPDNEKATNVYPSASKPKSAWLCHGANFSGIFKSMLSIAKSLPLPMKSPSVISLRTPYRCVASLAMDALLPKNDAISQGHAMNPSNKHWQQDALSQQVRAGMGARAEDNFAIDGASPNAKSDPADRTLGNPEGMGMFEQVGSSSGTAAFFKAGRKQGDYGMMK